MLLENPAQKTRFLCLLTAARVLMAVSCAAPILVQAQSPQPASPTLTSERESQLTKSPKAPNSRVLFVGVGKAAHSMLHGLTTMLPPTGSFHPRHRLIGPVRRLDYSVTSHPFVPLPVRAELEAPPDVLSEVPLAPPQLVSSQRIPVRPRAAASAPTPIAAVEQARMEIVPELTAEQVEEAKAETLRDLELTEKILRLAWGKELNASQQDLISKVHDFAESAREAVRNGDWERARTLSEKARVLSASL
jgi:hypothetical protein